MLLLYLTLTETEADKTKFEQIYIRYSGAMLGCAYNILKDKSLAEDAVHNAFIRILKNLGKLDSPDSTRTKGFVLTVAENSAKSLYAKANRIKIVPLEEYHAYAENVSETAERNISAEYVAGKIAELPQKYADVLVLRYLNGLSDKECASALGISQAAVRKRLERARKALAGVLGEE